MATGKSTIASAVASQTAGEHSGSRIATTADNALTPDQSNANVASAVADIGSIPDLSSGASTAEAQGVAAAATAATSRADGTGKNLVGTIPTDLSGGTADDIFINGLSATGLGSIAGMVQGLVNQGINSAGIVSAIRATPAYAARFPAIKALNAKGEGITESQYITKEDTDRQMLYHP